MILEKKCFAFIPAVLGLLAFAGCKSTQVSLSQHGPAAIVAVTGNQALPWEADANSDSDEDDGNGVLTTMVNKMIDGNNPELQTGRDRLDYAVDSLRAGLQDIAGIEVLDNDTVLKSQNYFEIRESPFNILDSRISASGFKMLSSVGAKRARMLMDEIGAKCLVILDFDFRKTMAQGTKRSGVVAPMLTMKVLVIDENGRELVNKTFEQKASSGVRSASGSYDKNELVGLYPELIDNAISQFIVSYVQ